MRRLVLATAATVAAALILTPAARGDVAAPPLPFSGSAAANGAEVDLVIPGAPVTDTLLNSGGPVAQASADSSGTSTGFASLPYPGDLVSSAPGLLAGFLDLGIAGLPPIKIPPLPSYPLQVTSNAAGTPQASVGAGPYSIEADSTATSSHAMATGGLEGAAGNAALLTSTASIDATSESAVATATSDIQGLTVGPLIFSEIKSTATESLTSDGSITPAATISIGAVRIGTSAVTISPTGLQVANQAIPLDLGGLVDAVLQATGVTAMIEPAATYPGRVVAPALVISTHVKTGIGTGPGTVTITTASATAAMQGAASSPPTPATSPVVTPPPVATGTGAEAGQVSSPPSADAGPPATTPVPGPQGGTQPIASQPAAALGPLDLFDLKSLMLVLAIGAAIALGAAPLYRLLGGR